LTKRFTSISHYADSDPAQLESKRLKVTENIPVPPPTSCNLELTEALARRSTQRWQDSVWFKNVLCLIGLHRWVQMNLGRMLPRNEVRYCRWCEKVRVNASIYSD
jgi:hypothetical protein